MLADGRRATVLRWIRDASEQYADCAARHKRLAEATTPEKPTP